MSRLRSSWRVVLGILGVHLALALWVPAVAARSAHNGLDALREVLLILPAILVLIALFDAWVPREFIQRNLGPGSGLGGLALALLLGTAAAGPIYAAFPVALALHRKGARTANVVLFLGAWGTIKIPMLMLEGAFLGLRFALLRLALTLPGLVACGFLMERLDCGPADAAPPAPGTAPTP